MKIDRSWRATTLCLALGCVGIAYAQSQPTTESTCPRTRAEVRDECIAFMKKHEWNEADSDWVVKGTNKRAGKLPEGVTPRAKIRAERDAFLSTHKWNEASSQWEPIAGTPRAVSKMSRAEVKKETEAFMRTHRWDESMGAYVTRGG